jgi:hypothetical protein
MAWVSPQLWYEALASPMGVVIATNDPHRDRMKLYALRVELKDPDLDCISVEQSPTNPGGELWLVKRNPDAT